MNGAWKPVFVWICKPVFYVYFKHRFVAFSSKYNKTYQYSDDCYNIEISFLAPLKSIILIYFHTHFWHLRIKVLLIYFTFIKKFYELRLTFYQYVRTFLFSCILPSSKIQNTFTKVYQKFK